MLTRPAGPSTPPPVGSIPEEHLPGLPRNPEAPRTEGQALARFDSRSLVLDGARRLLGAEPAAIRTACRRVLGRRDLTLRWLARARAAQITLGALAAFALFAWPPLLDRALVAVYPDTTVQKKVLGFLPRTQTIPDPRIPVRRRQLIDPGMDRHGMRDRAPAPPATAGGRGGRRRSRADAGRRRPGLPSWKARPGAPPLRPPRARCCLPGARYSVLRQLGRGGMGVVHLAKDARPRPGRRPQGAPVPSRHSPRTSLPASGGRRRPSLASRIRTSSRCTTSSRTPIACGW
jgi:hypothetical protein